MGVRRGAELAGGTQGRWLPERAAVGGHTGPLAAPARRTWRSRRSQGTAWGVMCRLHLGSDHANGEEDTRGGRGDHRGACSLRMGTARGAARLLGPRVTWTGAAQSIRQSWMSPSAGGGCAWAGQAACGGCRLQGVAGRSALRSPACQCRQVGFYKFPEEQQLLSS